MIEEQAIRLKQNAVSAKDAIEQAGKLLVDLGKVNTNYTQKMLKRQENVSVYIGNFVALPHAPLKDEELLEEGIAFLQFPDGVNFGTRDKPQIATLVFVVAMRSEKQLHILQNLAICCADMENVLALSDAQTTAEVLTILNEKQLDFSLFSD